MKIMNYLSHCQIFNGRGCFAVMVYFGRIVETYGGEKVQYAYDIRSNLTSIASPHYSRTITYVSNPYNQLKNYNGNVNSTTDILRDGNQCVTLAMVYAYDNLNRLLSAQSVEASDGGAGGIGMSESMTYDLNCNPLTHRRDFYGSFVQDVSFQYDGNQLVAAHDYSGDKYVGDVPQFPQGAYTAFSYNANGCLTADPTRNVTKIAYYDYGNLPRMVTYADGSTMSSIYRPDGVLESRTMSERWIETITKVNAAGDTIVTTRPRTRSSAYKYWGEWERTSAGMRLNTPAGYYSLAEGKHYWYLRDNLGSVHAVTDGTSLSQASLYYASGVPVDVNEIGQGENRTDRRHIGNRWLNHLGLGWHDNTARMHDALASRFTTPDPLAHSYHDYSIYSHCAGNPVNIIDPTGMIIRDVCGFVIELKEQCVNGIIALKDSDDEFDGIVRNEFMETLRELNQLHNSDQIYEVKPASDSNKNGLNCHIDENGTFIIDIYIGDNSYPLIGHEMKHAYQFETGKLSFKLLDSASPYSSEMKFDYGVLYDITDEVEAYNRERALYYGKYFFMTPNEKVDKVWPYKFTPIDVYKFGELNKNKGLIYPFGSDADKMMNSVFNVNVQKNEYFRYKNKTCHF